MAIHDAVEKKMRIETKLLMGFLLVYVMSAIVPGIVTFVIDTYLGISTLSEAMVGLITFCVQLILISIIAGYLMKWITKPVRKLSHAAERMVAGELDVDLEVESSTELQSISKSLQRMKSSLKIAHDWLGPAKIEAHADEEKSFGIGLNEKVIIGMVVFLILNPLVTSFSYRIFHDSVFLSSLVSFLFTVILFSLIADYLYQAIIKPLGRLADTAERLSKGDYSEIGEMDYKGDIGRLNRDFGLISARVRRAMKELSVDG